MGSPAIEYEWAKTRSGVLHAVQPEPLYEDEDWKWTVCNLTMIEDKSPRRPGVPGIGCQQCWRRINSRKS